jgi:AraC-like DNA-binding protein
MATESAASINNEVNLVTANDFADWCSIMSASFVPLVVSRNDNDYFRGRLRSRQLADASLIELTATPQTIERAPGLITESDKPYFIVSMQLMGTGMMLQDGREAVLGPGDMAIFDTNRPYTRTYETDFRSLVFRLPQSFLDLPSESISQLTATRFAGDSGPSSLVAPFLAGLANNMDRLSGHTGLRFVRNTADLIATMLHSELGARIANAPEGNRAVLLRDIDLFIEQHLPDPNLDPQSIAAANFISLRNLHGLFHDRGVSVSSWVRTRRLDLCQRDLIDPLLAQVPVASIAARWGLTDPAHFSRLFKRTYGVSPTDYRRQSGITQPPSV